MYYNYNSPFVPQVFADYVCFPVLIVVLSYCEVSACIALCLTRESPSCLISGDWFGDGADDPLVYKTGEENPLELDMLQQAD